MLPFQKLFCSLFLGWHVIAAPSNNTIPRYLELEEYKIFLNKVATSDDHSLYDEKMSTMPVSLLRMGSPGTYSYLILPNASRDHLLYVDLRSVELYLDTTWNLPKNISLVCLEQSNNPSIAENIDKALKSNKLALFIDDRSQEWSAEITADPQSSYEALAKLFFGVVFFSNSTNETGNFKASDHMNSSKINPNNPLPLDCLSSSIGSDMDNKQVAYFGSPEQAVEDLKKIQGWLGQKPVTLYFHPAKNALVKRAWYHFLDPGSWSHFYSKNEYFLINSIGAKIIPSTQEETGPFKDKEEMKQFLQNVFLPLKNYLSLPLIWKSYDLLEGNVLDQSTNKGEGLLNFSPRDPIKLTEFLREYYKIELDADKIVGTGGWGTVYKAFSAEQKYAVKIAKPQSSLLEKSSSIVKWRRLHELAASRLHLRNLVETDLIILGIESKNDVRYCALKPHQIKKFEQGPIWKRFLTIDPSTEMSVIVQVMKEAPGESLQTIIHRGDTFTPGTSAFNSFLNGSCSFIEDAMYANFVHLDITPENVYFDQNQGILTLIDTGFSVRGAKRYQDEKERLLKIKTKTDQPLTNPRTFQYLAGTYGHRPSKQRQHKPYGAEMNGERLMLFALRLISRKDYSKLRGLEDSPTKSFLSHYLDQLDSESKTVKAFNEHPEIREVIDLTLQLAEIDSGETEKIETLFTRWQKVFHSFQQKYGYEERTDFSAIHMKETESNL